MDESLLLARNIACTNYENLSGNVVDITKKSILDLVGVILAASTLGEGCKAFVDLAVSGGGTGESTILGFGTKVPSYMAAFANGSMAHALDFEDSHDGALTHPSAATVPAAFAVAESIGNVSGKEFITAVALGNDLVCRLGCALDEDLMKYGWYSPPILGAFGAAAAASKLLHLKEEQILDTFSLLLCQATCSAEFTSNHLSVMRSVRDAFSAKAGVMAALLAQKGIVGVRQPFEGKAGLFNLFARGNYSPEVLIHDLGKVFEGENVCFKPWPSCRFTHSYIDAVLDIVDKHHLHSMDIKNIHIVVNPINKVLCEPLEKKIRPETSIDAKFSLPFVIATTAVHKRVGLDSFSREGLMDPKVLELAGRVSYMVDETLTRAESTHASVVISTGDGRYSKHVKFAYGHPNKPISTSSLIEKFKDCAKYSYKNMCGENIHETANALMNMEKMNCVGALMKYFHC